MTPRALDHLVVAASTIDEGSRRVAETVGVDLDRGGEHPLMGTHNRLLRLGSTAYIEVMHLDELITLSDGQPSLRATIATAGRVVELGP